MLNQKVTIGAAGAAHAGQHSDHRDAESARATLDRDA